MLKKILLLLFVPCFVLAANSATDLDTLFHGKEYQPVLNKSLRERSEKEQMDSLDSKTEKSGKGEYYVLQFAALADFDAAQRRRAQLVASTGYKIYVTFDTPFYKLRGGGWTSKAKAEDKVRDFQVYNINAFVVKIR